VWQSGLPKLIFNGFVHSLQLLAAVDAGAAPTASSAATAAAQAEVASLKVLFQLGHCAWYAVLIIPAPVELNSHGGAALTELVESGERLCTASFASTCLIGLIGNMMMMMPQPALHPLPPQT
jgi:hypothetical protein